MRRRRATIMNSMKRWWCFIGFVYNLPVVGLPVSRFYVFIFIRTVWILLLICGLNFLLYLYNNIYTLLMAVSSFYKHTNPTVNTYVHIIYICRLFSFLGRTYSIRKNTMRIYGVQTKKFSNKITWNHRLESNWTIFFF